MSEAIPPAASQDARDLVRQLRTVRIIEPSNVVFDIHDPMAAEMLDAFASARAEATPPEHPTPAMIERGVRMHQTPRTGAPETLVHDIWQAMYDEWQSEAPPPAASDLERKGE